MNKQWWKKAVVYQIYPKSFCDGNGDGIGDLRGIISKLDYIKRLGVDIIWLSPIYVSPDMDNGYDISDYYNIQPVYGTMADFDELLTKTHNMGMRLVMDLVVNHTSNMHPWYLQSESDKNSKYRNYYYWRKGKNGGTPNNWNAYFGGSAWTYSAKTDEYSLGVFSPYQPDLNWSYPALRNEIYDMMRFWLDKGIDGFRLDAIHCIGKNVLLPDSADGSPLVKDGTVHEYLKEMNSEVLKNYDIMTVGEASGLTTEDMLAFSGFDSGELNMMIQFAHVEMDFNEDYKWNTDKIDLVKLKKLFNEWQTALYGKAWNSLYWSNHDQPRAVSRLGSENEKYREKSAMMIAVNTHFMCGTPFVFQGEEIGMTNVKWQSVSDLRDLESINAYDKFVSSGKKTPEQMLACISSKGRDNARTPMQWDSSQYAGFSSKEPWIGVNENYKKINASEQEKRENSVLSFYKKIIRLRKENEIMVFGSYEGLDLENKKVFAYKRKYEGDEWLVICNFTDENVQFEWKAYLNSGSPVAITENYENSDYIKTKILKPYEAIVISAR